MWTGALHPLVTTNVVGTATYIAPPNKHGMVIMRGKIFYHISTDEVYGSLAKTGFFYGRNSIRSAKSIFCVQSFQRSHGEGILAYLPFTCKISNCSNNYGPYHFPDRKLIPFAFIISSIISHRRFMAKGKCEGLVVCRRSRAIDVIFHNGKVGETYNIGGHKRMDKYSPGKKNCADG